MEGVFALPIDHTGTSMTCTSMSKMHYANWSSQGRSFVMRSLNPCPENFSQNVVDYPNLLRGGVIYYAKSEVLDLESNLLFLGGGGDLLHTIGR